jgi:putative chitinase
MNEITPELLKQLFPHTSAAKRNRFISHLNRLMPEFGIISELRVAAFIATIGLESDYLKATEEYASGRDYDISVNPRKAKGLGNYAPGDGMKYKGRGLIQVTGKTNYAHFNKKYGHLYNVDFVIKPELLEQPFYAVLSACHFWETNKLNKLADARKFFAIQGIVNRGEAGKMPLHWNDRKAIYERALRILPDDFRLGFAYANDPESKKVIDLTANITESDNTPDFPETTVTQTVTTPNGEQIANVEKTSFVETAIDANITSDDVKTTARATAGRASSRIGAVIGFIYAALEAGNIYAWLGVAVFVLGLIVCLWLYRRSIYRLWEKLKLKFTS